MNAERFAAILEAYGAEPRRWPAAERERAQAFAVGVDGRRLLARAAALDAALDEDDAPAPGAQLRARILEARPPERRGWSSLTRWSPNWARGAGFAAVGLAGVVFGAALSQGWTDPRTAALLAETEASDLAALPAELGGEQL